MNNDYDATMKLLIKTVVRMFYDSSHVVITSILLENILLSDTELCSRMKLLNREFNKFIVKLKEDNLIKYDIKVEVQEDNRQLLKTLYFFNFAEVRDVIKYKIFKMAKSIEDKINVSGEKYECPECKRVYSPLDAQAGMEDFVFKCILCKVELEEHVTKSDDNGIDLKKLMSALDPVIKLLKEAEKYKIPSLDYFQVLEMKNELEKIKGDKKREAVKDNDVDMEEQEKIDKKLKMYEISCEEDDGFEDTKEVCKKIKNVEENKKVNECMILINGVEKNIFEITEDDKENMTEEEYTRYFEMYSKYNET